MIGTVNFLKAINDSSHSCQLASSWQVFWDSEGRIHIYFLPHGVTIYAQYYSNLFRNDVHQAIQKKRPQKLSKIIILLHDNAHPHTANLMKTILVTTGWEIMNLQPYSPDLAPSNFHVFRSIMVHLEGRKFQTDDELKCCVLNRLSGQNLLFYWEQ
jgi:hypothetical protein